MTGTSCSPPCCSAPCCSISTSLITKRIDGIEARRAPRWVQGRKERQRQRHDHDRGGLAEIDFGRQARQKVKRWIEQLGAGQPRQELADRLDVEADRAPHQE